MNFFQTNINFYLKNMFSNNNSASSASLRLCESNSKNSATGCRHTSDLHEIIPKTPEKIIEFDNVTVRRLGQKQPLLDKVSFFVVCGEILGFAGVGGNGLGVIEAVLGGFLHPAQGKVLHKGKDVSAYNTQRLRKEGLAYVPADRLGVGSAKEATIQENMIINRRFEFSEKNLLNKKAVKEFSENLINDYNIEGAKSNDKCAILSGGNLQKLILARELNYLQDYIVFSEPTWGLDISSSCFVMNEITQLREKGAAVIVISTNLDEILSLSDRIIVMYKGRISGEFPNTKDVLVKEKINRYMHGQ
jgi:simple sugar transport system ATP-binding protein